MMAHCMHRRTRSCTCTSSTCACACTSAALDHAARHAHQELAQHIYIASNSIYIQLQRLQQRQLPVVGVADVVAGHPPPHAAKGFNAGVEKVLGGCDV